MKAKARDAGLWNIFLPSISGFTQLEYAPMAEEMGRSFIGAEVFNCSAPGKQQITKSFHCIILKAKARAAGLWNLFFTPVSGFTQLEYALMAEEMGRSFIGSEPFNCNFPGKH